MSQTGRGTICLPCRKTKHPILTVLVEEVEKTEGVDGLKYKYVKRYFSGVLLSWNCQT
jgi:hypothetical protein